MAQSKELEISPGGNRRARKALPVDSSGNVYSGSADRVEDRRGGPLPAEPVRPQQEDEPTAWSAEDIVEAEIVDETGPQGSTDGSRERLRDRAREFFGAKTRANTDGREQQRRIDEERAASDDDGLDERERLLKLRAETKLAGEKYMETLRDSKLLVPGFNDQERGHEFNAMHEVYMQMMMQSCLKPLTRGVNPNSIIQAAGMMMAMRMLSPDFRNEMESYLQPFKAKIQERMDARTRTARAGAESSAEQYNLVIDLGTEVKLKRNPELADDEAFLAGRESKKHDRTDYMSKKWQDRMEKMEHRDRGSREMFTPESAAMTEVALMENAFWKMRDSEQDSKQIHTSYKAMRKRLRDQMDEDGLDRAEVVKRARMIIGERMKSEPELRLMFNGVAHGRIVKAPPHEERMAGTDRVRDVWTGEFEDHLGRRIPADGMFTLRPPMKADEHQVQLAETMKAAMLDGGQRGGRQALAGSMMGYMVGFAAKKQGLDTSGLDPVLQQRLDQSEIMLASMDIDGIPDEEQQRVYSNAYVDAVEQINKEDPEFEHDLKLALGEDWQGRMRHAVDHPEAFFAEQRMRPKPFRQGPGPSAQQEGHGTWEQRDRGADEYQPV
jgi:hypothetical protein